MAFRLKHREPLGQGIARVYKGEGKAALQAALGEEGTDTATRVHEIRKHLKKMRALLRLVLKGISGPAFRKENHRLRDIGRRLSDMRDAEVRIHTFDRLREQCFAGEKRFPEIRAELARKTTACTRDAGGALADLAQTLGAAMTKGPLPEARAFGSQDLCASLLGTYQKGRAALRSACKEPTHDRLHELRKRSKDLWYDVRLLERGFPEFLKPQARELKQLTTSLGECLDLALLRDALAAPTWKPDTAPARKHLGQLIEGRQQRMQRASLDLASRFYAEAPRKFAKRLAAYCADDRCGAAE